MRLIAKLAAGVLTSAAILSFASPAQAAYAREAWGDDLGSGSTGHIVTWWEGHRAIDAFAEVLGSYKYKAYRAEFFAQGRTPVIDDSIDSNGRFYVELGWDLPSGTWLCVDIHHTGGISRTCRDAP